MQFRHRLALAGAAAVTAVAAIPAAPASAIPPNPPPALFCGNTVTACVHYLENIFSCSGVVCEVWPFPLPVGPRE